jgi:hypothetical protein
MFALGRTMVRVGDYLAPGDISIKFEFTDFVMPNLGQIHQGAAD